MQSIWRQEGTGLVFIRQNSPQIAAVAMVEGIPGTEEHVLEVQCHAKSGRRRAERQPCVNYEPSDHLNTALIISCTPMEISNAHLNNSLARNGIQLQTPPSYGRGCTALHSTAVVGRAAKRWRIFTEFGINILELRPCAQGPW